MYKWDFLTIRDKAVNDKSNKQWNLATELEMHEKIWDHNDKVVR